METTLLYIGRILFGGYFAFSGFNHFKMLDMMSGYAKSKGAPMPKLSVAFSGVSSSGDIYYARFLEGSRPCGKDA